MKIALALCAGFNVFAVMLGHVEVMEAVCIGFAVCCGLLALTQDHLA